MDFVKYIINCFKVYYPKFLCECILFILFIFYLKILFWNFICWPACHMTINQENYEHVNVLINHWNINLKSQGTLEIIILAQRDSAEKKSLGNFCIIKRDFQNVLFQDYQMLVCLNIFMCFCFNHSQNDHVRDALDHEWWVVIGSL